MHHWNGMDNKNWTGGRPDKHLPSDAPPLETWVAKGLATNLCYFFSFPKKWTKKLFFLFFFVCFYPFEFKWETGEKWETFEVAEEELGGRGGFSGLQSAFTFTTASTLNTCMVKKSSKVSYKECMKKSCDENLCLLLNTWGQFLALLARASAVNDDVYLWEKTWEIEKVTSYSSVFSCP